MSHLDRGSTARGGVDRGVDRGVAVGLHSLELSGHLTVPAGAHGVVLFVGDPNPATSTAPERALARRLTGAGLGTLSVDLIAADERDRAIDGAAPDTDLLAVRVLAVTRWLRAHPDTRDRSVAYFGSSAGVGAALLAAAEDPSVVALVARDGRPDAVVAQLAAVRAPTLLLVHGGDAEVVAANEDAVRHLRCDHALVVVPPSPDPMSDVAGHSVEWFARHVVTPGRDPDRETTRRVEKT